MPGLHMDSRAFRYALEPVLSRSNWQLDAATRSLAEATSALAMQRDRHAQLEADLAAAVAAAAVREGTSLNVSQRAHVLRYLGKAHALLEESAQQTLLCNQVREKARVALDHAHRSTEVLAQHRQDSRREYAETCARRAAVEADNDWTARQAWQRANGQPPKRRSEP